MGRDLSATAPVLLELTLAADLDFDKPRRRPNVRFDCTRHARLEHGCVEEAHPLHESPAKLSRHLNCFQNNCLLEACAPRVGPVKGSAAPVEPHWAGCRSAFSSLFENSGRSRSDNAALRELLFALLKKTGSAGPAQHADPDEPDATFTERTRRRKMRPHKIAILDQIDVVAATPDRLRGSVSRSKAEPIRAVARTLREHVHGISSWTPARLAAATAITLDGLFRNAKLRIQGCRRFEAIQPFFFGNVGKPCFAKPGHDFA